MKKSEIVEVVPSYFKRYVKYIRTEDAIEALQTELEKALKFYEAFPKEKYEYRYEVGKWHVKEVLSHVIETERVMAYRALAFSREDQNVLHGFNQDQYVVHSRAGARSFDSILLEFEHLRKANILMFESFDDIMMARTGRWDSLEAPVAALAFIMAGHEMHHRQVVADRVLELL